MLEQNQIENMIEAHRDEIAELSPADDIIEIKELEDRIWELEQMQSSDEDVFLSYDEKYDSIATLIDELLEQVNFTDTMSNYFDKESYITDIIDEASIFEYCGIEYYAD